MSQTILVVEDEPAIADNITYALTTEGFDAIWCATGEEALKRLYTDAIDLIILDVGLPDVHGFELAKTMRRQHDLPLIFVTARSGEIDRVVGLEIGADDYVVKPFSPRELTARVKAVLRRTGSAVSPNPVPAHSRFHVDEVRQQIAYYGVALTLTRYEYRLLRLLVQTPGRVYDRQELMQRVWEEPEQSLDRTVDTHIKRLRQKLKAVQPHAAPILTYRGMGYALEEGA